MSWKKYFQIISIILLILIGIYCITPKYTFNEKGTRRKNVFTGKVELQVGGEWMTPEEYQNEESQLDSKLKSMPSSSSKNSNEDVWVPVNSQN